MRHPITTAALLTLSLTAQAGVYKCEIDGKTVYQQVACPQEGSSTRVQIIQTPVSNRTGGLRASEVQALRGIAQSRNRRRDNENDLNQGDARYISSAYTKVTGGREGEVNQRETKIAEAHLRQTLGRYGLKLEDVEPQLSGETILDRVQDEIALREAGAETQSRYREQRRQLLAKQEAEERAREEERRARQRAQAQANLAAQAARDAQMASQAAQAAAQANRMLPVITTNGTVLIPNDPGHNTYTGAGGGTYIRQGNTAVRQ